MASRLGFENWNGGSGTGPEDEADANERLEFGRLLIEAVKKFPDAYAEFLRLADQEEAAREARTGCGRCRGRKVLAYGED